MPLEWSTLLGWVVTLLSGIALQWIHRLADNYSNHMIGRLFLARDPPRRPPVGVQKVALTDAQLHHINQAVMEGQRPLVEATQALHAELAAAVALLSGDPKMSSTTPAPRILRSHPLSACAVPCRSTTDARFEGLVLA
ncbi:MAG: hypothetical protein Q9212_006580 [Teloschistes hypoglaucus]